MALYDWNHNGKKDIEDDFIEYEIYKNSTNKNNSKYTKKQNGKEISTFGAILSIILGLVFTAVIFTLFHVNIDNVPTFVIWLIWMINSFILSIIATIIGI